MLLLWSGSLVRVTLFSRNPALEVANTTNDARSVALPPSTPRPLRSMRLIPNVATHAGKLTQYPMPFYHPHTPPYRLSNEPTWIGLSCQRCCWLRPFSGAVFILFPGAAALIWLYCVCRSIAWRAYSWC